MNIKNHNTKLNYKINGNLSYGFLKNRILELLTKEAALEDIFKELQNLFIQNTIPIRPNRNNKRNVDRYRTRIKPLVLKNQKDAIKQFLNLLTLTARVYSRHRFFRGKVSKFQLVQIPYW